MLYNCSLIQTMDEMVIARVRELLGEHCNAWAIAAEDAEGNFWSEYSTPITGRALHDHASERISQSLGFDVEWEDDNEDGEYV